MARNYAILRECIKFDLTEFGASQPRVGDPESDGATRPTDGQNR